MRLLVTGANRGIGAAMLAQATRRGWDALGTARSPSDGLMPLDVTRPESLSALAGSIDGPIDTLVCNAGVYPDKGKSKEQIVDPALWADTFAANTTGVFLTVMAFMGHLQQSETPKIAIISSQMGSNFRAKGGGLIYRASKAAAINLGRNLAVDLRKDGIAVGIYHPGWVRTDMGGDAADISAAEAASGLIQRFAALSPETTGCFETWDGQVMPA